MSEKGFYHPSRGYWQTVTNPTAAQRAAYPFGTVEVPLRPSAEHEWDGVSWAVPQPDTDAALQAARAAAWMSKPAFLLACMQHGILTPEEAHIAATGGFPGAFAAVISQLSQDELNAVNVIWPASTRIERLDPFIMRVAELMNISPEMLDAVFGVSVPA